jgi:hypothetical protein
MDETTRLRMRRGHTKHKGLCTCGAVVCGNGGKYQHREMHRRREDGHHYLTYSVFQFQYAIIDAFTTLSERFKESRIKSVTDPELDAPDGSEVDGYVRRGDQWCKKSFGTR